eukprot:364305-Chlamydomonas_euryale.AAC.10
MLVVVDACVAIVALDCPLQCEALQLLASRPSGHQHKCQNAFKTARPMSSSRRGWKQRAVASGGR